MAKNPFHIKASAEVLKWARESLSLAKSHVAKELGITPNRLDHLERGSKYPTIHEIKMMSKLYKRTVATLLLNRPPEEKPLPRDCRTINSAQFGKFHEKTILAVRKARALAASLMQLKAELNISTPQFTARAHMNDDPTEIAVRCRQLFGLQEIRRIQSLPEALEGYIERLESFGIGVFQISLTQDGLRGFSITDDVIPIIVIKRGGELVTTKIFTLFHELGHILLNKGGLCDITLAMDAPKIEKWCNAFAAELLVPSSELLVNSLVKTYRERREMNWLKRDLEQIGKEFHVGPLVILRRLLNWRLTTIDNYREKHALWNRPSFGRSEHPEGRNVPKETIRERGKGFVALAFKAYEQNKIDIKDLSDYLGIGLVYLPKTRQLLSV